MNFTEALQLVVKGSVVARESWSDEQRLYMGADDGRFAANSGDDILICRAGGEDYYYLSRADCVQMQVLQDDMLASDWVLVSDKESN